MELVIEISADLIEGVKAIIFVNFTLIFLITSSSTDRPLHDFTIHTVKFLNI